MITFYICRHGQSEYNLQQRMQGQIDTPLTELGLQNAQTIAEKLKDVKIDEIYSSDLGRALHTALIIAKEINLTDKIIPTKYLREGNFGDFAGKTINEIEEMFPGFMKNKDFIPPSGESLNQVQKRVIDFLIELEEKMQNRSVLLVSHDTVINTIFSSYSGNDLGEYNEKNYNPNDFVAKFIIDNGKITLFEALL